VWVIKEKTKCPNLISDDVSIGGIDNNPSYKVYARYSHKNIHLPNEIDQETNRKRYNA
jgi:hypothetical protein